MTVTFANVIFSHAVEFHCYEVSENVEIVCYLSDRMFGSKTVVLLDIFEEACYIFFSGF